MSNYSAKSIDNVWEAENQFFLKSHPQRLAKFIGFYELYKMVLDLPGTVVECGVYKGASIVKLATFRSLLENDWSRRIVGFDVFGKFPEENLTVEGDRDFVRRFEAAGGEGISADELQGIFAAKCFNNLSLVEGNVFDTVPSYLDDNPQLRISLLHLDLDVYEPTKFCLENFFPRMVKGGVIVFDDYNAVAGASQAVDEMIEETGLRLEKLEFNATPAYCVVA